ncbi:hypothetical protein E2562_016542 [Oryza meyeriana var. granulata]|uniref:Uncharacterized protein n=1 Tax=Oryza meyeriana var. granulata TaxID=110450 RepID=A0A6G1C6C7_9ORYZ|nr:hypothetical protein E2562_016542 [Oryza meyeriana var. granulata]
MTTATSTFYHTTSSSGALPTLHRCPLLPTPPSAPCPTATTKTLVVAEDVKPGTEQIDHHGDVGINLQPDGGKLPTMLRSDGAQATVDPPSPSLEHHITVTMPCR